MEDNPTCGRGLAHHSALPATVATVFVATADVLENHIVALDQGDPISKREADAYRSLVRSHRGIGRELERMAGEMSGYRDLPMGRHDMAVMSAPESREVFEKLVRAEEQLLALLQAWLPEHRGMLASMAGET